MGSASLGTVASPSKSAFALSSVSACLRFLLPAAENPVTVNSIDVTDDDRIIIRDISFSTVVAYSMNIALSGSFKSSLKAYAVVMLPLTITVLVRESSSASETHIPFT